MTHSFTATDRCDRGQSERAVVLVAKDTHYGRHLELQLCAHHYEENRDELEAWGWTVSFDARERAAV